MAFVGLQPQSGAPHEDDRLFSTELSSEVQEAFFGAIERGNEARVEELLNANSFLLDRPNPMGHRPLMMALSEGHHTVVSKLLKCGADYSFTDLRGNSPIHLVSAKGNYEALKAFLNGVDLPNINLRNKNGDSVLMAPAARGFSIVVECLLEHDADPNIANNMGRTPLMEAAQRGHRDVVKVLVKNKADVLLTGFEDYSGMPTALKEAISNGSQDIVAFLMEQCTIATKKVNKLFECKSAEEVDAHIRDGWSVDHKRGNGCTALMFHAESGNLGVVQRLLDVQALMDIQDILGQTALMKSSHCGHFEVVRELVKRGALINLKCKDGNTALMYGVMGKCLKVVKELVNSGADLTIANDNGKLALDMAETVPIIEFLKKKSAITGVSQDPFCLLVNEYLKEDQEQKRKLVNRGSPSASLGQANVSVVLRKEEPPRSDEPLRLQLDKYIKRVAELETRVEELTIKAEFSVIEEDLTHYRNQPDRLIEECQKLKTAKKKAEDFAVEAKQSAQKASVELTQLKEDFLMEKQTNELTVKRIIVDMEDTVAASHNLQERMNASYDVIKKALDMNIEPEELGVEKKAYTPEEVLDVIVRGNIKTWFKVLLVAVSGLPQSGKTTLTEKLVLTRRQRSKLGMYEIAYCSTSRGHKLTPVWEKFDRDDIFTFMLCRALTDRRNNRIPMLKEWSNISTSILTDPQLREHIKNIYEGLRGGLLQFAETGSKFRFYILSEANYVLLNLYDVGSSKALNEALPLVSRLLKPIVLLNVLNLHRDGRENLRKGLPPEFVKNMGTRSRGHYLSRICGFCHVPGKTILIGTHQDKLRKGEARIIKRLTEAGIRAKAADVRTDGSLTSDMLAVNLQAEKDVELIKREIETVIESEDDFRHELHLSWIFLRSALMHYKYEESDYRMPRHKFDELANQCGLKSKADIENCLNFFTKIGSMLYDKEFFGDIVIYRPPDFFSRFDELYQAVESEKHEHCRECLSKGVFCKKVVKLVWETSEDDEMDEGKLKSEQDFFWNVMQQAGIACLLKSVSPDPADNYDYGIKCPHKRCNEKNELLFVSTLRKDHYSRHDGMNDDSLYVTYNGQYMPGDISTLFVKRFKSFLPEIKLELTTYYNYTKFQLPNGGSIHLIVHGDVTELAVKGLENNPREETQIKVTLKNACVMILNTILQYFPMFCYQIGFLCPHCRQINSDTAPNNNIASYLHILPTEFATHLYCRQCSWPEKEKLPGKMIELSKGQQRWLTLTGNEAEYSTSRTENYEERVITKTELVKIVNMIPLDFYSRICTTLSPSSHANSSVTHRAADQHRYTHSDEAVAIVLSDWQRQSPSNRREKLARILLRMDCYKAAIKLDPKVFNTSTEEIPPNPHLDHLSCFEIETLCNYAIQWKSLAKQLKVPEDKIEQINEYSCRSDRERCRKVLEFASERGERHRVIAALEELGWETAAESLRCGYTNKYNSYSIL